MEETTLHAHWMSDSRDCDGPHSHYWDEVASHWIEEFDHHAGGYRARLEHEFDFEIRMSELLVKVPYGGDGEVTVTLERKDDGRLRGHMSHSTEEGFSSKAFYVCDDDDYDPVPTQRDVYAERMGY
jgi:hypothetical protein